jgi:hypothetical protein
MKTGIYKVKQNRRVSTVKLREVSRGQLGDRMKTAIYKVKQKGCFQLFKRGQRRPARRQNEDWDLLQG